MPNYCSNCGKKLEQTAIFCPECGRNVSLQIQRVPFQHQAQPQQPIIPNVQYVYQQAGYQPTGYQQSSYYGCYPVQKPENIIQAFKWTTYTGRINRQKYLIRGTGLTIFCTIIYIIAFTIATQGMHFDYKTGNYIGFLAALPISYLSLCNSIKRAHNLNKPAMLPLICIIPNWIYVFIQNSVLGILSIIAAAAMSVYLTFFKGTTGSNQYGDDPLMFS